MRLAGGSTSVMRLSRGSTWVMRLARGSTSVTRLATLGSIATAADGGQSTESVFCVFTQRNYHGCIKEKC